jgi:hypothetical protein
MDLVWSSSWYGEARDSSLPSRATLLPLGCFPVLLVLKHAVFERPCWGTVAYLNYELSTVSTKLITYAESLDVVVLAVVSVHLEVGRSNLPLAIDM